MEREKSDLEKEIAAILKKHTKKGRKSEVAGVVDSVLPRIFRMLDTGDTSEDHSTASSEQREENKKTADHFIWGFLWAMLAAGLINAEKRSEMEKQIQQLRYK